MKITRVHATPLNLPVTVTISGRTKTTALSLCLAVSSVMTAASAPA